MMEIRLKSRPPSPYLTAAFLLPMQPEYVPGLPSYCRLQKIVMSMIVVFDGNSGFSIWTYCICESIGVTISDPIQVHAMHGLINSVTHRIAF